MEVAQQGDDRRRLVGLLVFLHTECSVKFFRDVLWRKSYQWLWQDGTGINVGTSSFFTVETAVFVHSLLRRDDPRERRMSTKHGHLGFSPSSSVDLLNAHSNVRSALTQCQ